MKIRNPKNSPFPIVVSVRDYFSTIILSDLPTQRRGGCGGGGGEGYSSTPEVPVNCLSNMRGGLKQSQKASSISASVARHQQSESQINGDNSCFRAKDHCGEGGRRGVGDALVKYLFPIFSASNPKSILGKFL